jgi:hypothetical protein
MLFFFRAINKDYKGDTYNTKEKNSHIKEFNSIH